MGETDASENGGGVVFQRQAVRESLAMRAASAAKVVDVAASLDVVADDQHHEEQDDDDCEVSE